MRFRHTKCDGEINVKTRTCKRCKKKWDPISFRLDPVGIRPIVGKKGKLPPSEEQKELDYNRWTKFIIGAPYLDLVVSKLPKWPRWARILVTVTVLGLICLVVYLIRR